jgi:hypothetical protein
MAACQSSGPPVDGVAECKPAPDTSVVRARVEDLAGEYRLTMVATRGSHAGRSVAGVLALIPFDSASRYPVPTAGLPGSDATYALHGHTDVSLDSVGARSPGATSINTESPGVLVIEWGQSAAGATRGITLRFGSEANRSRSTPFDGAFVALHVAGTIASGFEGSWIAGGSQPESGGHFCATRVVAPR